MLGGQKILFLADAEWGESDRLVKLDNSVLKADILQYAHHGYDKQCKANLYEKLSLPFIPSGDRITDYHALYENLK